MTIPLMLAMTVADLLVWLTVALTALTVAVLAIAGVLILYGIVRAEIKYLLGL